MTMEDKPEKQQLADVQAQLARARRAQVRNSAVVAQQKDTLKRLIELAHSPYSSLKTVAASNIKLFIKDFPELEDDAINAVYDLCEDQDPKVRKDGYRAITSVSREQRKWVKRNADVLVQLLQSDEPEEVEVIEQQLTEHLDMDPNATLGVLCDQVVPPDEPVDEEEQAIRDRLRGLVLGFMTGRAKRGIVERHASSRDSPGEETLVREMYRAISRLPPADVETIVKEVLLPLPTFSAGSERCEELLSRVLAQAKEAYKSETPHGGAKSSLARTRQYLALAVDLVQNRIASPTSLLRFLLVTFAPKVVLQNLSVDAQALIIKHTADTLNNLQDTPRAEERNTLRNQAIDASVSLLVSFTDLSDDLKPWDSCVTILKACKERVETTKWKPQPNFLPLFRKLEDQVSSSPSLQDRKDVAEEVQSLIRLLLQHTPRLSSTAEAAASAAALSTGVAKGMSNGGRVQSNKRSNPDAPPARPVSMPGRLPVQSSASSTPQASTSRHERQGPPHLSAARPERQRTRTAPASPRATPDAEPPAKRQRGLVSDASVPSLLSRMALASSAHERAAATVPAKRRAESEGNPRPRRTPPSRQSPTEAEAVPPGGWSIKGAARAQQPEEAKEQAASLLDRLKQNDHGGGGNSRRKRTKT